MYKVMVGLVLMLDILCFEAHASIEGQQMLVCKNALKQVREGALLLDVRTGWEYAFGALPGSVNIPYDEISYRANELPADKNRTLVVYCRSGRRSAIARSTLIRLGYLHVYDAGGYSDLKKCWDARK